jgi:hypothetical protein
VAKGRQAARELGAWGDVTVVVRLAREAYVVSPDAVVYTGPEDADPYVRLHGAWLDNVFARGFAALAGRFVLVQAEDEAGRPREAVVLDLEPDLRYHDPEHPPADPDHRFVARSVRITWVADRHTDGGGQREWSAEAPFLDSPPWWPL